MIPVVLFKFQLVDIMFILHEINNYHIKQVRE